MIISDSITNNCQLCGSGGWTSERLFQSHKGRLIGNYRICARCCWRFFSEIRCVFCGLLYRPTIHSEVSLFMNSKTGFCWDCDTSGSSDNPWPHAKENLAAIYQEVGPDLLPETRKLIDDILLEGVSK